ncbi:DNA cytosine methyltransferase [Fibrisoma montanum]|uniref:DNA cytosine methyltransferase n=1 Tax=Fibrisoma montanum TaxID=2305895 RepID=UPI0018F3EDE3
MGWESRVMVELDPFCQKVLRKNFPNAEIYGDINTFDGTPYRGAIDLICGGFPCQPYSQAGLRKGKEDERHLWPSMLRVISEVQPRWVVGENVSGILNWSDGLVVHEVLSDLESLGYETIPPVNLPAAGVNAPHERQRVWFVAYAGQIGLNGSDGQRIPYDRLQQTSQQRKTTIGRENRESIGLGRISTTRPDRTTHPGQWDSWYPKPMLCGVDDGFPRRLDDGKRLGALGNAVVPQVVYQLFQAIQHIEDQLTTQTSNETN